MILSTFVTGIADHRCIVAVFKTTVAGGDRMGVER